jgi:hypothetical protein
MAAKDEEGKAMTTHDLLGIYLNDHLADATTGTGLARGWRRRPSREPSVRLP